LDELYKDGWVVQTMNCLIRPSLTQVMVMMQVVLSSSLFYKLFKCQCYWHSSVLYAMICDEFGGWSDDETHTDWVGQFKSFPIAKYQTVKAGYVQGEY
jgi:hypothetical protein